MADDLSPLTAPTHQRAAALADVVVLWDLDRTLVDLRIDIEDVRAWKRKLERRFLPLGWTEGWSPMLPCLEAALNRVGASVATRAAVYEDLDRWEMSALTGVSVHDATLALAGALWAAGVTQAIITNNGPTACRAGLAALSARADELGWPSARFAAVATRAPDLRAKPDTASLEHAISLTGRPFRGALVIGDAATDRAAAKALAARTTLESAFCLVVDGRPQVDAALERRLGSWGLASLFTRFRTEA